MVSSQIPISFVKDREIRLNALKTESADPDSFTFEQVIDNYNNPFIDESYIVEDYIKACKNPSNSNIRWRSCLELLNMSDKNEKPYAESIYEATREILMNCTPDKYETIKEAIRTEGSRLSSHFSRLSSLLENIHEADRVINNKNMIGKRYDLDNIRESLQFCDERGIDTTEIYEQFATLMDTYNMPLRKKVAVALETMSYLNYNSGIDSNRKGVNSIMEYYIFNNPIITDRDYTSIKNTLESNRFIDTDNDTVDVRYISEYSSELFSDMILEANKDINNEEIKNLVIQISNCKTVSVAKGLIKSAFRLIFSLFIIATVATFSEIIILICTIFGLILTIGLSPIDMINTIKKEFEKSDKALKELNATRDQVKRYNKVYKFTKDIMNKIQSGDALKEASETLGSIVTAKGIDAPLLSKGSQYGKYDGLDLHFDKFTSIEESKDYADSDDVKELIKQYKADQNKTTPKLKRVVTVFMTQSPERIIDDLPDIVALIRNCVILSQISIPIVGPALALIGFIINQMIQMKFRREETERVIKYFKKEKEKMENKLSKTKNEDKKDDIDSYIKCLDKAIDRLEEYYDELLTDAEIDARFELDEASMNILNRFPADRFYTAKFPSLCNAVRMAVQVLRNEIIRNPLCGLVYDEYTIGDQPISNSVSNISKNELLSFYTTPNGIIDIPLGKIKSACVKRSDDKYMNGSELCVKINEYLRKDKDFIATCYEFNGAIVITLNSFICIETSQIPEIMDHSMTESAIDMITTFKFNEEIVNQLNECDCQSICSDICSNISAFIQEDPDELSILIHKACIPCDDIIYSIKNYRNDYAAMEDYEKCNKLINSLSYDANIDDHTLNSELQSVYQLEATELLRNVIEEAKKTKAKPIDAVKTGVNTIKNKAVDAKDAVKNKAVETKDNIKDKGKSLIDKAKDNMKNKEKVDIATTAKLAGHNVANKAKDVASKEKEVSKTVDAYASNIMKACKGALTSNRREAIIKGSIIPSFSKMIKSGLVVGGITLLNPIAGAITAVGALAMSKHLTNKEKQLLLEEIEVEIEVIDKQLESVGEDPKRHKELLMYRRKLARESQRIRYGLSIKAKEAPDPNA